jgi:hypothetical protein
MTPEYEIILVQTAEQRQECYDVVNFIITSILVPILNVSSIQRIAVFHMEQKFPLETEIDEPVIPFPQFNQKYQNILIPFLQYGRQGNAFSLEADTIAHSNWYHSCLQDARG